MNRGILENRIHERIMAMHYKQNIDELAEQIINDLEQLKDINCRQLKQRQTYLKEYAIYTLIKNYWYPGNINEKQRPVCVEAGTKLSFVRPVNNLGKKEDFFNVYVLDTEEYLPVKIDYTNNILVNFVIETRDSEMSEIEKEKVMLWRFQQFQNDPEIGKEDCEYPEL